MLKRRYSNKFIILLYTVLFLLLFAIYLIFGIYATNKRSSFLNNNITESKWVLTKPDGQKLDVTFPLIIKHEGDGIYRIETKITNNFISNTAPVALFLSNHLYFKAYINNVEIQSFQCEDTNNLSKSPGNRYNMIDLPLDAKDKMFAIEFKTTLGNSINYEIPTIVFGDKSTIITNIIKLNLPSFVLKILLLFSGIILILFKLITGFKTKTEYISHTGVFSILFALYGLCENSMIVLLSENSYLIYLGDFLIFALLPLPFLLLYRVKASIKYDIFYKILISLILLNFVMQIILHFCKISDLRESLFLTHILIVLSLLLLIISLIKSPNLNFSNKKIIYLKISPLVIGALIDLLLHILPIISENTMFIEIGIFVYLIIDLISTFNNFVVSFSKKYELEFYRNIAYIDSLCGIKNRAAFYNYYDKINSNLNHYNSIWCISMDLNNLKYINDHHGHNTGDIVLKDLSKILVKPFSSRYFDNIFRIGGDEFVFIGTNIKESDIIKYINLVHSYIDAYNKQHDIKISLAMGYDRLKNEDTLKTLFERADKLMYINKDYMKSK